ncbi:putative Protein TonB [uncultured Alphaproteobacteria bacterium]|uniref:Periplasmic protein TonB n=1 Tax=uncultured Alphaproteobacteria bacterium TaxID=91750 RepID=A0A212JK67_9PROT|nr:putative Protein TonB [uncultured Alphaproteobacteria bacterium]
MIRLLVVTAFLFSVLSVGLVAVKTRVQEMETRLSVLQRDIRSDRDAIRVLKAEWSHLNDPVRLKRLADAYLKLSPVTSAQIASVKALPFAAPDAPEARTANQPARPVPPPGPPEVASRRTAP